MLTEQTMRIKIVACVHTLHAVLLLMHSNNTVNQLCVFPIFITIQTFFGVFSEWLTMESRYDGNQGLDQK